MRITIYPLMTLIAVVTFIAGCSKESPGSEEPPNSIIGQWTVYVEYDGKEKKDGNVEYLEDGTFVGETGDGTPAKGSWKRLEQDRFRMEYVLDGDPVAKEWFVSFEGAGFTLTGVNERGRIRHAPKN